MKNTGHNAQLGIPTLVIVFVNVAHTWRVIQPETEDQALYDNISRDILGLVFGGTLVESVVRLFDARKRS